jgi:hypothetical protein
MRFCSNKPCYKISSNIGKRGDFVRRRLQVAGRFANKLQPAGAMLPLIALVSDDTIDWFGSLSFVDAQKFVIATA